MDPEVMLRSLRYRGLMCTLRHSVLKEPGSGCLTLAVTGVWSALVYTDPPDAAAHAGSGTRSGDAEPEPSLRR